MTRQRDAWRAIVWARSCLGRWASDGLMPFREARPLALVERRRVVAIWAGAGTCFACLWAAALVLVMPGFHVMSRLVIVAILSLVGGIFFGAVGLAVVSIFSRSFERPSADVAQPPGSQQSRLARDREPLPLDPE